MRNLLKSYFSVPAGKPQNWELLDDVWELLGDIWELLGDIWEPLGHIRELLGDVWELLGIQDVSPRWGAGGRGRSP